MRFVVHTVKKIFFEYDILLSCLVCNNMIKKCMGAIIMSDYEVTWVDSKIIPTLKQEIIEKLGEEIWNILVDGIGLVPKAQKKQLSLHTELRSVFSCLRRGQVAKQNAWRLMRLLPHRLL